MTIKILALDTATENCSVALKIGENVFTRCEYVPRDHTLRILPLVDEVLQEAQVTLNNLDALAFGRGPGSFTGVRIGVGIAQGLAFGANLPTIGVSTLAAMAAQAFRKTGTTQVLSAIDARMSEVYWGEYQQQENGDWQVQGAEIVVAPDLIQPQIRSGQVAIVGTGWGAYPDLAIRLSQDYPNLLIQETDVCYPEAQDMLMLAQFAWERGEAKPAAEASPIYLRDTVAWKKLPGR